MKTRAEAGFPAGKPGQTLGGRAFEIFYARVLLADARYRRQRPEQHQQRFGMKQLARASAARLRAMSMPADPLQGVLL